MRRIGIVLVLAVLGSLAFGQPSYFVKADMVRGAEGAQGAVCVPNSVFFSGEMIVFRAVIYDGATGEELTFDQVQERGITATVRMEGRDEQVMFFPPPTTEAPAEGEEGPPPGADYFRGPWAIPADYPTGLYGWTVAVTDTGGNGAEFVPIGASIGAGSITIQAAN